ncbi:MAG TPA: hypothetical protein VF678_14415, partial [bacterium]
MRGIGRLLARGKFYRLTPVRDRFRFSKRERIGDAELVGESSRERTKRIAGEPSWTGRISSKPGNGLPS